MKKRILTALLLSVIALVALFALSACGDKNHEHTYAAGWTTDAEGHWHAATCEHTTEKSGYAKHTFGAGVETLAPTESTQGVKTYTCTACGYQKTEPIPVLSHQHTYAAGWTTDAEGHWHAATCAHSTEKLGYGTHTLDAGEVTLAPTDNTEGVMTYTCTVCGYEKTEAIPSLSHVHTFESVLSYDNGGHYYASSCGHNVKKDYEVHDCEENVKAATCTEGGYTSHDCDCGYSYITNEVDATDHTYASTLTKTDGYHYYAATCGCDVKKDYKKHSYNPVVTAPTCDAAGYTTYTCACGAAYTADPVNATGHTTENFTESGATLLDEGNCYYAVSYAGSCLTCGNATTKTENMERHNWFDRVTTPATCAAAGQKGVFCSNESCRYHDEAKSFSSYEDSNAHVWVKDNDRSGATLNVYTCSVQGCIAVRRESTGESTLITGGTLENTTEVNFPEASLELDEAVRDKFKGQDVTLSAGTLNDAQKNQAIADANLTPEQEAKLADAKIYNFTLVTNQEISELGGTVTVRIPYTLAAGEDPSCVVICHIVEGELRFIEAVYSEDEDKNGFVTFETTHFSYYTVIRLTPKERCERYGHLVVKSVLPTCESDGFALCARCGSLIVGEAQKAKGHNLATAVVTDPTCDTKGLMRVDCADCDFGYDAVIPALGHVFVLEESVEATCAAAGYDNYKCARCEHAVSTSYPKLAHEYTTVVIAPTCAVGGHTERTCTACGDVSYVNITAAAGHSLSQTKYRDAEEHYYLCIDCGEKLFAATHIPGPAATETEPQVCTDCGYILSAPLGHEHVTVAVAAVSPTCTAQGNIAYYVCSCGAYFADAEATEAIENERDVILSALGHLTERISAIPVTCTEDGLTAGVKCIRCQTILSGCVTVVATGHTFKGSVTPATCETAGSIRFVCTACRTEDETRAETLAPFGHTFVDTVVAPTCETAGYTVRSCKNCTESKTVDAKDALGHSYAVDYTANASGHWHVCVRCEGTTELEAHTGSRQNATETQAVICIVCDYEIAPVLTHEHTAKTHVYAKNPTCVKAGNIEYYTCRCGKWFSDSALTVLIKDHATVVIPALGHQRILVSATDSTCEAHGYTAGVKCTRCSTWLEGHEEKPLAEHSYGAPTYSEADGKHKYVCATNSAHVKLESCAPQIVLTVVPTCETAGYTVFECSICKNSYQGNHKNALGHKYTYASNNDGTHYYACQNNAVHTGSANCNYTETVMNPTCTEQGYTKHVCKFCGYTYKDNYKDALDHNWSETVIAPTCETAGYTLKTCSRCPESETVDPKDALGHDWTDLTLYYDGEAGHYQKCKVPTCRKNSTVTEHTMVAGTPVPPTCVTMGYTVYTCDCGYSEQRDKLPSDGGHDKSYASNGDGTHVWICSRDASHCGTEGCTYTSVVTPPTCTEGGYTTYTCKHCGYEKTGNETSALGHSYTYTKNNDGMHSYACTRGDDSGSEGCSYTSAVTAPTCTEKGYTTHTCKKCSYVKVDTYTDELGHDWTDATLYFDGNAGHYQKCAVCGEKGTLIAHTMTAGTVVAPTCVNEGYTVYSCDCRYSDHRDKVPSGGGHDVEYTSKNNGTHSYKCKNEGCTYAGTVDCTYETDVTAPTCTEGGYTTYTCKFCDYTYDGAYEDALGHDYIYSRNNDGTHNYACTRGDDSGSQSCTYETDVTAPTCTEGGYTTYTCEYCDYSYNGDVTGATGHDTEGVSFTYSTTHHYKLCKDCSAEVDKVEHTCQASVTDPTCEEAGKTTYTCSCGYSYNVPIPATGHDIDEERTVVTPPTCTEDGYTTTVCDTCGQTFTEPGEEKLGHNYSYTRNNDGTHYYVCQNDAAHNGTANCNYKETVHLPDCTKGGYTQCICQYCGYETVKDEVGANGHSYEHVTTKPTCEAGGYTTHTCSVCGDTYVDGETDALGHDWTDPKLYYTEDGHFQKCKRCGGNSEAQGHNYVSETVAPTCTEGGYVKNTCECGYSYNSDAVDALGHDFAYTYCYNGTHTYVCQNNAAHRGEESCSFNGENVCEHCEGVKVKYSVTLAGVTLNGEILDIAYYLYMDNSAAIVPEGSSALEAIFTENENVIRVYLAITPDALHVSFILEDGGLLTRYLCDETSHEISEIKIDPTCHTAGFIRMFCTRCGAEIDYVAIPESDHEFASDYEKDEEHHWHSCLLCSDPDERIPHDDGDADGYCDGCGYECGNGIAYYFEMVQDGTVLGYCTFYTANNAFSFFTGDETVEGNWVREGELLKLYLPDSDGMVHFCSFQIFADNSVAPYYCPSEDAHEYILVESQEQTCGQDGYNRYVCTICAAGHQVGVPATGNHTDNGNGVCANCGHPIKETECSHSFSSDSMGYDSEQHWFVCTDCGEKAEYEDHIDENPFGDLICDVCGYQQDISVEDYRDQTVERVHSTFADLEKQYGDLSAYEEEYQFYVDRIMTSETHADISVYYEKYLTLVDSIRTEMGEDVGDSLEEEKEKAINRITNDFNQLSKEYDTSRYGKEFEMLVERIRNAESLDDISSIVNNEFKKLEDDIRNSASSDVLRGVTVDNSFALYVGSTADDLAELLTSGTIHFEFSMSGDVYLPITLDMFEIGTINLNSVGTYELALNYSISTDLGGYDEGSINARVRVLPLDYDEGKIYIFSGNAPMDWSEARLMTESGYIDIRGFIYPIEKYGELPGVYAFFEDEAPLIMVFDETTLAMSFYQPIGELIGSYVYTLENGETYTYNVYNEFWNGKYVTALGANVKDAGVWTDFSLTIIVDLNDERTALTCPYYGEFLIDENGVLSEKPCEHENTHEVIEDTVDCLAPRIESTVCKDCGQTLSEKELEPLGHNVDASGNCTRCGLYFGDEEEKEEITVTHIGFDGNVPAALVGENIEEYLENNILGRYMRITFSNSPDYLVSITRDMLSFSFDKEEFWEFGIAEVEMVYTKETPLLSATYRCTLRIPVEVDLSDMEPTVTYTLASMGGISLELYSNNYAYLYMPSRTQVQYTFENGYLVFTHMQIKMVLVCNEDNGTADFFYPVMAPYGQYTYVDTDETVTTIIIYDLHITTDEHEYVARVSGGSQIPFPMTVLVWFDPDTMTIDSVLCGGLRDVDGDGNIYCNHDMKYNSVPADCYNEGYEEQSCDKCGYYLYEKRSNALGHEYGDDDLCIRCGECKPDTDEELESYRNETIQDITIRFSDLLANYSVTDKHHEDYQNLKDSIYNATSVDEIDKAKKHFQKLENEIIESSSSSNEVVVNSAEFNSSNVYGTFLGDGVESYLVKIINTMSFTIFFSDGTSESFPITMDMIVFPDGLGEVFDVVKTYSFTVELRYSTDRFDFMQNGMFDVTVTPNFDTATLEGSYVQSFTGGLSYRYDLYDNGYAKIFMMYNGEEMDETVGVYYLEETLLKAEFQGVMTYLTVDKEKGTAVPYLPEGTSLIGTYTYGPACFDVYGNPEETQHSFAIYRASMTEGVEISMSVLVHLDTVNRTFYADMIGRELSYDENNALYCNHDIIFEIEEPTCENSGYRKGVCRNCDEQISYTDIAPSGHSFDENGNCTSCGYTPENDKVEEEWIEYVEVEEGYESAFVGDNVEEYLNKAIVGHQLIAVYKPSGLSKKIPITFDMIENGFAFDAFPDMGVYMFTVRYVDEMGIEHYIELPIDVGVDLSDAELRGNYTVSTGNDYSMSLDLYNNGYAYLYENGETRQISFNEDENGVIFFEMLGTWVYFVANDIDHVLYSLSFMGAPIGTYYASGENGDITFTVYGTYNGSDDYYAAVSGSAVPFTVTVRVYLDLENLRFGSSLVGGDRDIDPDSGNIYCDHDYEYKSVGADCYNGAYEESWCTRCGKYNREERSEALGHEYNDEGCCTRCGENNTNGRVLIEALREQTRASMHESFNSIPQVTGEQQQTFTKFLDRLGTAANEKDIITIRDEFETFIRNIEAESKTKVVDYWETNFNEPYELKVGEDLSEYASTYVGKAVTIYFTNGTAYSCDLTAENISFDGTSENVGNEVLICFTVWVDGEGYTFTFPVYVVE